MSTSAIDKRSEVAHTRPLSRAQRRQPWGALDHDVSQLEEVLSALDELARSVDDPRLLMLSAVASQRLGALRGCVTNLGERDDPLDEDLCATDLGRCFVRSMQRVRAALDAEVGRVHLVDDVMAVAARPAELELACEQLLLAAAVRGDSTAVDVALRREHDGALLTMTTSARLGSDTLMRVVPQLSQAVGGGSEGVLTMTASTVAFRCGQVGALVDDTGTTVAMAAPLVRGPRAVSTSAALEERPELRRVG